MKGINLSEWALHHRQVVWFLMALILIAGGGFYFKLGRNEDPSFTIKTMVIQAGWPGATITDTIQQVTDRIEKKLQEVPGLDFTQSYTVAGQSTVYVNLSGAVKSKDVPDTWYQVRKKLGDIRYTFPSGTTGPVFNDEFGDTFGIVYAFTADGFSERELRDAVERARDRLLTTPDVGKIDLFGLQDEKIYIEFSAARLAGLSLDRQAVLSALSAQNAVTPAGIVETQDEKIAVQVTGGFTNEVDLRQVNFSVGGKLLRLSDLATVTRRSADPPQPMYRYNGTPAIGLAIAMREGGDVLTLGRNIEHAMAEITAELPVGIEPHLVAEQPKVVEAAVDEFMDALFEAVAIVLAVSFLSLGLRAGAVVALSIPLVLAAVFACMAIAGIDLQRISLGALIIALGLLVDDAMITVETMVTRLELGWDKVKAATFAYTSTAFPMLTGTLVTVAGFLPIGFSASSAGEYTFSMFAVVAFALLISWVVAVLFAPLIGATILAPPKQRHGTGGHDGPHEAGPPGFVMVRFRAMLLAAMRARWITISATLVLFVLSLGALQLVPKQFFPSSDRPELLVDLKLSQSASISAIKATTARFDAELKGDPDIDHWTTYVGRGAIRFYLPLSAQLPTDFFGQVVIVTKGLGERDRVQARLTKMIAEKFPEAVGRVYPLELGPPQGWPLQYRVTGPEPARLRDIAYQVAGALADNGAEQINFDWIEPMRIVRIHVDQDQARRMGVSSESLAQALNTVVSGARVTQVRDGIYLIDVVVRAEANERLSLSTLRSLQVQVQTGKTVSLMQLASIEYSQDLPLIWRRNREPVLTVQADVAPGLLPATAVERAATKIAEINEGLPTGYRVAPGGSVEESAKSQKALAAVLPVAGLVMVTLLMFQLQSFSRLFLVLSVAPFGLIGVAAALLIFNKPLGFVALLGVIALVGMIVRNSVILVDQIEVEIAAGRRPWEAVVEATQHRFRPILLTAAAAILGMIPIAPTVFWGPMAYAIMGGLAVATALTLLFLPALYVAWFRIAEPKAEAT